jgi:hypothetical protein
MCILNHEKIHLSVSLKMNRVILPICELPNSFRHEKVCLERSKHSLGLHKPLEDSL